MHRPDPELMTLYGTESVYLDKLANRGPLAAALALPVVGDRLAQVLRQPREDESVKVARRVGRLLAKHAGPLGAVLSLANRAPSALATGAQKLVKPVAGRVPGLGGGGWKAKALVGGLGLVGGYGALQAGKALYGAGMKPAPVRVQGGGPALPRYVNPWGVPT